MLSPTDRLSPTLTERILKKLGFSAPPPASINNLQKIYKLWCHMVPFDNVRKLISLHSNDRGLLPGDEPSDFFEHWLKYGTGGTCWAGNGALFALLATLEFKVQRGVATMMVASNIPPNHGTVIATCDGIDYVVDASILHEEPLRLDPNMETAINHQAWGVKANNVEGRWVIHFRSPISMKETDCRIEYMPATKQEFSERHAGTRAWSPFNYELKLRINYGDSALGLSSKTRHEIDKWNKVTSKELTPEQRTEMLVSELGFNEEILAKLPEDQPTPPPPEAVEAESR